jgi:hypothetical protein
MFEVVVAVVLVLAAGAFAVFLLGALEGIVWWVLKIVVLFVVLYVVVRLVASRSR